MLFRQGTVFLLCVQFQIDADKAKVGEDGEIDFKDDAKFAQHLKKDEAVSDFAKTKTLAQQRQYLPIYSIRDELLQVTCYLRRNRFASMAVFTSES